MPVPLPVPVPAPVPMLLLFFLAAFFDGLPPGLLMRKLRRLLASPPAPSAGVLGRLELTLPSVLLPPMLFWRTSGDGWSGAVPVADPVVDEADVSFCMVFFRRTRVLVVELVLLRREGAVEPSSAVVVVVGSPSVVVCEAG